ncbi:MAG: NUDIX domain-containing protein [Flavobacteriaceae bacterium]|nr:NUDIX domain-containing protein [Flavobacteriaceae bacterium]
MILTTALPKSKHALVLPLAATSFQTILQVLKETRAKKIYLIGDDPATLLETFKSKLSVVQAGGGLVRNQSGKMLFIFRKGKWDLPKGKIDKGESLEEGAKREVKEETGVKKLQLNGLAGVTYHIFKRNDKYQLKETYWFNMTTTYTGKLKPELQEDITKAKWKGPKKTAKALENSYGNIKHLLKDLKIS